MDYYTEELEMRLCFAEEDALERESFAYEQGREDAIDELLNNVSESIIWDILAEIMKRNIGASEGADKIIDYLQKIAEQMKERKNETD